MLGEASFNYSSLNLTSCAAKIVGQQLFSRDELFKRRFHLGSPVIPVVVIYEGWINIWLSLLLKAAAVVADSGILARQSRGFAAHIYGVLG